MSALSRNAQNEIVELQKEWGTVPPRKLAAWVKKHPDSALYAAAKVRGCFDPDKAMEAYLLTVCGEFVRLVITVESGKNVRQFVSLVADRGKSGAGYRDIHDVLTAVDLRSALLEQFFKEMQHLEARFRKYEELAEVFAALDVARAKQAKRATRRGAGSAGLRSSA